jgi:hypothetical protein
MTTMGPCSEDFPIMLRYVKHALIIVVTFGIVAFGIAWMVGL